MNPGWNFTRAVLCRSVMSDSATPRTVAHQAPLSMGSPGKDTGVGCHSLLQGIFPTQGSNLSLLYCRQMLYHLSHQGSPNDSSFGRDQNVLESASVDDCLIL